MEKLLQAFIDRVDREHLAIEGIAVMEDGCVTAEHRWTPDLPRNIYSHTKSFMATFAAEMHMLIFDRALTTIVAYCIF